MKSAKLFYAILALAMPGLAPAAQVTREYTFSASAFEFAFGTGPAPVDPAIGRVRATFDDSVDAENVASGVTFSGFNFAVDTLGATPAYSFYTDFFGSGPALLIGTLCTCGLGSVDQVGPNADNFLLGIFDPTGTAASGFFAYSQADYDDVALAGSLVVAAVPEPGAWLLMIAGLGASGARLRRRPLAAARL